MDSFTPVPPGRFPRYRVTTSARTLFLVLACFSIGVLAEEPGYQDAALGIKFPNEMAGKNFRFDGVETFHDPPRNRLQEAQIGYSISYSHITPPVGQRALSITVREQGEFTMEADGAKDGGTGAEAMRVISERIDVVGYRDLQKGAEEIVFEGQAIPFRHIIGNYNFYSSPTDKTPRVLEIYSTSFRNRFITVTASCLERDRTYREQVLGAVKAVAALLKEAKDRPPNGAPPVAAPKPSLTAGTAIMRDNGTIVLQLHGPGPDGETRERRLVYAPTHSAHGNLLKYIGFANRNETVLLKPWPEKGTVVPDENLEWKETTNSKETAEDFFEGWEAATAEGKKAVDRFSAIAISEKERKYAVALGWMTLNSAKNAAIRMCEAADARVIAWTFGGEAEVVIAQNGYWAVGTGKDRVYLNAERELATITKSPIVKAIYASGRGP
jgi:hypothetical protein